MGNLYRPKNLEDLVGCENIKATIKVALAAAKAGNKEFPHSIVYAPSGLGKTTLANIIANEMNVPFKVILADIVKNKDDVRTLLAGLNTDGYDDDGNIIGKIKPSILFLDEIHQLSKSTQESLFQAMEDNVFSIKEVNRLNGKEEAFLCWVPKFTLIGATTKIGKLDIPFTQRFGLSLVLEVYSIQEICEIIRRYAVSRKVTIVEDAATLIAQRSRGTARKAITFFERCSDTAIFFQSSIITEKIVEDTFGLLKINSSGLDTVDMNVLTYLYRIYPQKVGSARLSSIVNITEETFKEIVEPYLLREELIYSTPGGRIISETGMQYLEKNNIISSKKPTVKIGGKIYA